MVFKIIKAILPILFVTTGNFCFGQTEELRFMIDTSASKGDAIDNEYDYYNKEIIRCKTFYNYGMSQTHFEFIRLENGKYFCIEYKPTGERVNQGVVRKELLPYDELNIPIYDSTGRAIGSKKFQDYYKLYKDEYWYENFDSGYYNYNYGIYHKGKKDSTWIHVKRKNVEREMVYKDGSMISNEVVDLTGTGDKRIPVILIGRWKLINGSFSTLPLTFEPNADKTDKFDYIEFHKDGTYERNFYTYFQHEEHGKWKLTNNNTIIKLMPESGTLGIQNLEIDYISKYGLNATFSTDREIRNKK